MIDKIPMHVKLDEHNSVKKPLLSHLDGQGRDIIAIMQDLLTGKKRITPLLTEPQEAGA